MCLMRMYACAELQAYDDNSDDDDKRNENLTICFGAGVSGFSFWCFFKF